VIEVRVGAIERHPVTGAPLVALEPCGSASRTRLVLPLSAAVACSLRHELDGQVTLRATAYALLGQVADALGGEIRGVEIVPAASGMAAGRVCISGATGDMRVPVEIAMGIGLAVVLGVPLRVAAELVHGAPQLDHARGNDLAAPPEALPGMLPEPTAAASEPAAPTEVPEAFRRAFSG
jgi:bifunctional DNase/RNase